MKYRQIAAAAAAALALSSAPAMGATKLTFASWVPWTHQLTINLYVAWMKAVEKASNGEIEFHRLPKGIGHPRAYLDAVRTGQIDAGYSTHGYSPKRFLAYRFGEFPFAGDTAVISSLAVQRTHDKFLADKGYYKGAKLIGMNTVGPGIIHLKNKLIRTPADMKGVKVRTGGPIQRRIIESLGGVSVSQPATKAYEIISTGIVDGTLLPWESVKGFKLTGLIKYSTYVPRGLYTATMYLVVNQKAYDGLSPVGKKAIDMYSGENFARMGGKAWIKINGNGKAAAVEAGVKILEAPKPVVDAVAKLNAKFEAEYVASVKKIGLDGRAILDYFRAQVATLQNEK